MTKTKTSYQELFNDTLSKIRIAVNATGNRALGDVIVKILFDLSDALKQNELLREDKDYEQRKI